MKKTILILLLCLPCFILSPAAAQSTAFDTIPGFTVRSGLPYVHKKLSSGQKVKIAYFGGSITEASGGWRDQSLALLKQRFPSAQIEAINAGIGGTGSDLGAFRLKQQVLDLSPDLVFVEFAVNDISKPASLIYKTMEGIVRQIRRNDTHTDICFVYTITGDMGKDLQKGIVPRSTAAMEVIAAHYQLPGVHMGARVVQLAAEGKLVYKGKKDEYPGQMVFSADNVHPFADTGQKLYAEALGEALDAIFKKAGNTRINTQAQNSTESQRGTNTKTHTLVSRLPAPYSPDNWEQAKMIPVDQVSRTGGWQAVPHTDPELQKVFKKPFTSFIKATAPGAVLSFSFRGALAGLYDIVGPGCGQYEVSVDRKAAAVYPRFDSYSTYYRPQYFVIQDLDKGIHTISMTVSGRQLDKKAILKQREQVMENEERYAENACYAGYILLIGELVK